MSGKVSWSLAFALALIFSGCAGKSTPPDSESATNLATLPGPAATLMPTDTPPPTAASLFFGTVANGVGCAMIRVEMAPPWPSPFFSGYGLGLPEDYGWREQPGEITAPDGSVFARVGDRIELEGTINPTSFCLAPMFMATSMKLAP